MLITLNSKKFDISELINSNVNKSEIKEYYANIPFESYKKAEEETINSTINNSFLSKPRSNLFDEFVLQKSFFNNKPKLRKYKRKKDEFKE